MRRLRRSLVVPRAASCSPALGAALAAAVLGAATGCGREPAASSRHDGAAASATPAVASSGARPAASAPAARRAPAGRCPAFGGDDWAPWDDFGPSCNFVAPRDASALPAPVAWGPCPAGAPQRGCRWMKLRDEVTLDAARAFAAVGGEGGVQLGFEQRCGPWHLGLVAAADGRVLAGLGEEEAARDCELRLDRLGEGRWIGRLRGHRSGGDEPATALVYGVLGDLRPRLLETFAAGTELRGAWISERLWASQSSGGIALAAFGRPRAHFSGGGEQQALRLWHDRALWHRELGGQHAIATWSAEAETAGTLYAPQDPQRQPRGVGTDGSTLVWTELNAPIRTCSVLVAELGSPGTKLQPRRLRALPCPQALDRAWTVGCGRAALPVDRGVQVVGLRDGRAWLLPSSPDCAPGRAGWCLVETLALTCDEIFVAVDGARGNVARIRLGELGEGTAADGSEEAADAGADAAAGFAPDAGTDGGGADAGPAGARDAGAAGERRGGGR